jgi:hypothetical protein
VKPNRTQKQADSIVMSLTISKERADTDGTIARTQQNTHRDTQRTGEGGELANSDLGEHV